MIAKEKLSKRENDILNYIKDSQNNNGYPPAIREIGEAMGLKSTSTVQYYIKSLEKKGYIRKDPTKPRTIEVLKNNDNNYKKLSFDVVKTIKQIPIVGTVAAGQPILAEQNIEGYFSLPEDRRFAYKEMFGLKVKGESMINAGILPGDVVIVEQCDDAENGEIVVAMTEDNEATVKRFYSENGHYRLQPENDYMEPIILDYVKILGKVSGVFRIMR